MEYKRRKSHAKRNIIVFFLFVFLFSAGFWGYRSIAKAKPAAHKDVLAEATHITATPQKQSRLAKVVGDQLVGTKGSYGIVIVNLHTGERYLANEHKVYKSASLYKLWVMATVFEQIQMGKLAADSVLSESMESLNKKFGLSSPSPSLAPDVQPAPEASPGAEDVVSYTVSDALEKMITISDNYAALLLTSKVGLSNITAFLQKHEFTESKLGSDTAGPTATPSDIALFFIKLSKGDLAPHEYTEKMLGLLRRQRLNSKLPKYLPAEVTVGHKTGELDEFTHDAGIVYAPGGEYLIVVLTESDSRFQAEERISNVSKAVYNYFNENH